MHSYLCATNPRVPLKGREIERERDPDFKMVTVTKGVYSLNGTGTIGGTTAVSFMLQGDVIY